jgi:aryl-alcohol dehydrogenase-like predicted oxidoreductase
MKLVLGSAQIGMNYGLFNNKKINSKEFRRVQKLVINSKIKFIDTATSYGDSEKIIGNSKLNKLNIITKIKLCKKNNINIEDWVVKKIIRTTNLLKINRIYGLLVHDFNDLLGKKGKKYLHALQELKRRKVISKIGVSIYDPDEIGKIWKIWKPDIVQFPLNVFDNRILYSGWIDILKKFQIKMYARSVFLQGLLINNSDSSEFNKSYKFYFNRFEDWCSVNNISKVQACLHFVKQYKKIDYLVVGFNNYNHLKEIIDVFKKKQIIIPNKFSTNNINLIDPRRWNYKRKF